VRKNPANAAPQDTESRTNKPLLLASMGRPDILHGQYIDSGPLPANIAVQEFFSLLVLTELGISTRW
jgi:hypothetical protein